MTDVELEIAAAKGAKREAKKKARDELRHARHKQRKDDASGCPGGV